MLHYFCGLPKCGKSLLAERGLAEQGGRVLYVGTLPDIRIYRETIRLHRERRPEDWDLYECTGEPLQDMAWLDGALERYDGVLLDGPSFYLQRALCYYEIGWMEVRALRRLLKKAAALPVRCCLVDQPLAGAQGEIRTVGRIFHEAVYRYAGARFYVEDGEAVPCPVGALRQFDGGG